MFGELVMGWQKWQTMSDLKADTENTAGSIGLTLRNSTAHIP
ncbi:hypothetical protein QE357_000324 [Siphonobacter sp. BAB-5404]|nr:hypothetical protein [Siphonobacter sp. SORGH_AS_1065]MDR6193272.1 hypothetical protein [Siphonobacter sp. SORGH_AS_0500]